MPQLRHFDTYSKFSKYLHELSGAAGGIVTIGYSIGFFLRNLPTLSLGDFNGRAQQDAFECSGKISLLDFASSFRRDRPMGGHNAYFFPATSAAHIGWQVSPFQFEVGMADLAIGITACLSFWRDLSFKAAAVSAQRQSPNRLKS